MTVKRGYHNSINKHQGVISWFQVLTWLNISLIFVTIMGWPCVMALLQYNEGDSLHNLKQHIPSNNGCCMCISVKQPTRTQHQCKMDVVCAPTMDEQPKQVKNLKFTKYLKFSTYKISSGRRMAWEVGATNSAFHHGHGNVYSLQLTSVFMVSPQRSCQRVKCQFDILGTLALFLVALNAQNGTIQIGFRIQFRQ